jgi:hypothetical protein
MTKALPGRKSSGCREGALPPEIRVLAIEAAKEGQELWAVLRHLCDESSSGDADKGIFAVYVENVKLAVGVHSRAEGSPHCI